MRFPALSLVFLLAAGLVACDAVADGIDAAPATAVTLDARDAVAGDILYDIEPLAVGESFVASLDAGPTTLAIRSVRQAHGYDVTFESASKVERVLVNYLFNGTPTAASFEVVGSDPVYAGSTAEEPESWHWIRGENGRLILTQDNMKDMTGPAADGGPVFNPGTLLTTPTGEQVRVTHVQFEIVGLDEVTPTAVRFESPRAVQIESQELRRGSLALR